METMRIGMDEQGRSTWRRVPGRQAIAAVSGYASVLLRLRWPVVALATLIMLAMAPGARFIGVTNDYRSFFDDDNPQLAALHALEATCTPSKVALIAIAPKGGSVFTRETLGAIEELTESAWRTPWSIRVDSLTNHPHSEAFGDDWLLQRGTLHATIAQCGSDTRDFAPWLSRIVVGNCRATWCRS